MSLYLPEQKLGSHSSEGGSSNKFILKGRQTGTMHRGHTWVFRAESHDTMMAWYEDIKALTEKTPEERSQFVRSHSRSMSRSSRRSVSSDGLLDEDDEEPFSAETQIYANPGARQYDTTPRRSQAGGRFPSDIQVNAQRGLQASHSPSSVSSNFQDHQTDPMAPSVTGALLVPATGGSRQDQDNNNLGYGATDKTPMDEVPSHAAIANQKAHYDGVNPYTSEPIQQRESVQQHQNGDYFVPVVMAQNQGPNPEFANTQDTRGLNQYEEMVAAEQFNSEHEQRQTNGAMGGKTVNVMAVDGEGFPNLGGPVVKDEAVSISERESLMDNTDEDDSTPIRPTAQTARKESVQTISNLHIPGGYPKSTPV